MYSDPDLAEGFSIELSYHSCEHEADRSCESTLQAPYSLPVGQPGAAGCCFDEKLHQTHFIGAKPPAVHVLRGRCF